ncbi:dTDP-4-dehydrorhamnose reductase [Nitratireductor thuwali]|uniref:dTDP-4-dehydrorhamnose reductase n=1 Tax=Nitratireductor thuwali TaxID=2267699 RepID=A0ABY5MJR5_9HYPH|nr:dTDP-4-dehydrorhamnose reductase [Nitratireductor thuwali]
MRILVTGREGQVARALAFCGTDGVSITCVGRPDLDITDRSSIDRAIKEIRPDILVNPAAYTAVDKAESEPETAFAVNRDGARNAAAAAAAAGMPVVHLSTDYVFAGDKPSPYVETDATGPASVYGHSKLAGEEAVAEANPAHVILRTAWVYSPWGHNFVKTMLRLAETRDTVRVVADQHGAPTYAPDIADCVVIVALAAFAALESEAWRGTYHVTAAGETNWAGFAEAIFAASAARGGPTARVEPISTADYPTPARRPRNSRLSNGKFCTTFAHTLPDWRDRVQMCVAGAILNENR